MSELDKATGDRLVEMLDVTPEEEEAFRALAPVGAEPIGILNLPSRPVPIFEKLELTERAGMRFYLDGGRTVCCQRIDHAPYEFFPARDAEPSGAAPSNKHSGLPQPAWRVLGQPAYSEQQMREYRAGAPLHVHIGSEPAADRLPLAVRLWQAHTRHDPDASRCEWDDLAQQTQRQWIAVAEEALR